MIPPLALAATVAAAFAAGVIDAMVGGGGLLQLPALFAALPGTAPPTLLGTSKLAGFMGTGAAAWRYGRHVPLPARVIAPGCALGIAGGLLGAALATHTSPALYRPLVPVLLITVLLLSLAARGFGLAHQPRYDGRRLPAALAGVSLIAVYDGFFGPGTGTFLMFMLIRVLGFDFLHASAMARVLNVATNLAALAWFCAHGNVMPALGLTMGVANVCGALIGTRLALRGGSPLVRKAFVFVVALLIVKTAVDAWPLFRLP